MVQKDVAVNTKSKKPASAKIGDNLNSSKEVKDFFKSNYTSGKRLQELVSVIIFVALEGYLGFVLLTSPQTYMLPLWTIFKYLIFGVLLADFISGLAHWGFDTWLSVSAPVIGNTFIRSFREHHVDMQAMCRHDWLETNGDNCFIVIPAPAFGIWFALNCTSVASPSPIPVLCFAFSLFISVTNQIHKWSHEIKPAGWVQLLQNAWIILPKKHHSVHHRGKHDDYYCITTGWLNFFLSSINFWRISEKFVSATTGLIPREDDQYWLEKMNRRGMDIN